MSQPTLSQLQIEHSELGRWLSLAGASNFPQHAAKLARLEAVWFEMQTRFPEFVAKTNRREAWLAERARILREGSFSEMKQADAILELPLTDFWPSQAVELADAA
jgi:hypothetical protein